MSRAVEFPECKTGRRSRRSVSEVRIKGLFSTHLTLLFDCDKVAFMALTKDDLKEIRTVVSEEVSGAIDQRVPGIVEKIVEKKIDNFATMVASSFQRVENTQADHTKLLEDHTNLLEDHTKRFERIENKFSNHERRIGTLEEHAGIAEGSVA